MSDDVYRRLASRLDAIPNGFPATESGVELRLLATIFMPEEAALAAEMSTKREPADVIGARAGVDSKEAYGTLKTMARKGQIRVGRREGMLVFGLMPFVVGILEEQLPRLDEELAVLFEDYFQEMQGALAQQTPAIHRVIPVEEAVPVTVEIYPYERASQLVAGAKAWGVRDCICRIQQKLVGKGCDRPVENCLVLAPVAGVFEGSETTRSLGKEEALLILAATEEVGLVHSAGNYQDGNHYICNCCTCCCGVLRNVAEFGMPNAIATSGFFAVVSEDECAGCGDCLGRCQFGALALVDAVCEVDAGRCVGCGLCVTVCSTEALRLERRAEGQVPALPQDFGHWQALRAEARGLKETA